MANINKVDLNLGHKIANPFKTTRKSDTNPFKYSNFEGNTLQFADVFEGFEPKNTSKLKMITSSVMGSITKMRSSITEPIVNFVNRVRDGISNAWTYAKNTNIEIAGLQNISNHVNNVLNSDICKGISDVLNYDIGKGISKSFAGIKNNINDSILGKDVTEIGQELSGKWSALISGIKGNKVSSDMPVAQLRELWLKENGIISNAEVKVA